MGAATRYEIIGSLATGDFATVYRGRDRELGRDVAIKEIHPHFRRDPKQLERYWREAQLLASLQHPNVITIYDVVRPRGWLILELMRGSLQKSIEKGPIDLDFLREVLTDSLHALDFLHKNGIVHGDIKPSNLLLDKEGRVKLGDFGLARRATDEHGSLLKGTTKYMAPELISAQFGPVGPASDLYSLGFTAYELMCGPDFELLFPTLSTFGRDRQIAWMMWHASADQKLPPIHRVLEGVPEDLAEVVDRLVQKNQQERIRSASEALQRLKRSTAVVTPPPIPEEVSEAEIAEQKRKRTTRIIAIAAVVCSLVLSALMLLPVGKKEPPPATVVEPVAGRVEQVLLDARLLIVDRGALGKEEREIRAWDEVFVNDKKSLLRDLQPGDQITITVLRDEQGRQVQRIEAVRPERLVGQIEEIAPETGSLTVIGLAGEPRLAIRVPQGTAISLNAQDTIDGKSLGLTDLTSGDRVELEYQRAEKELIALKVAAYRVVRSKGVVQVVDPQNQRLQVELSDSGKTLVLPWSPDCVVSVNGQTVIAGQLQKPTDLLPNDQVEIDHDVVIRRIEAYRILGVAGTIQQVHFEANAIDVLLKSDGKVAQFTVPESCEITLGSSPATLGDLRAGDQVDIQHDTPGATTGRALKIVAVRPANPARFALLVGVEEFDDQNIPKAAGVVEGLKRLADILIQRGAFPRNQTLVLTNPSRVRFEQSLSAFLKNVKADSEVVIYYVGCAAKNANGQVFLLSKESQLQQLATSATAVQFVADALEQAAAKAKLLLIDVSTGTDSPKQPFVSAEEALRGVAGPPGTAPFRTVTAIAACSEGEASFLLQDGTIFSAVLNEAYSGKADENRDGRIEVGELYGYLSRQVPALAQNKQTPRIFLPDNRPPRLSEEAKTAIRQLAAMVLQDNVDPRVASDTYRTALKLSGKEPEPTILYALVQIKMGQTADAQRVLEALKLERPRELIIYLGLAWVKLLRRDYVGAVQELNAFVQNWEASQVKTDPGQIVTQLDANRMFMMVGQLREFAERVADDSERPNSTVFQQLDDGVKQLGEPASRAYSQGRQRIKELLDRFDEELSRAPDQATAVRLRYERRQLGRYTSFPFEELSRQVIAGLDR